MGPNLEVFLNREMLKYPAALDDLDNAHLGNLDCGLFMYPYTLKLNGPIGDLSDPWAPLWIHP